MSSETHIIYESGPNGPSPPCFIPSDIADYNDIVDISDDEIAYETAFGTTCDTLYMDQYQKHNRTHTKFNSIPGTVLSPTALRQFHEYMKNGSHRDHEATIHTNDTLTDRVHKNPSPKGLPTFAHSIETAGSVGAAIAMQKAPKYYNDMVNQKIPSIKISGINSVNDDRVDTNFKFMSYSAIMEGFEQRTIGFGQTVMYDMGTKQYFSKMDHIHKRHVLINLHVNRITEIDTVRERFRCQFWISFSWLPTYFEWVDYKDHELSNTLTDWKPSWVPIITFPELVVQWKLHFADKPNSGKFSIGLLHANGREEDIGYNARECKFIRCKLECDLTFATGFLLMNFPLDCQDLPISIHETSGSCIFVAEKRKRSFASIHTISSVMEEWEFVNMMIEIGQLNTGGNESSLAQIKVRLKMQRRFEVYLWNVVFFMALISGLTLCSFAVDDTNLGERIAIIITLLLTSVAYQSNVFSTLPNVPYLTLLDKYIVTSFLFMTLVTVETAMLGTKYLDDEIHNHFLFMVTWTIFMGYHLIFLVVAIRRKDVETKKLYMPSKTIQQLYNQTRERMDVDWSSERQLGSTWKIYTKYPDKLITKTRAGREMYRNPSRSKMLY